VLNRSIKIMDMGNSWLKQRKTG